MVFVVGDLTLKKGQNMDRFKESKELEEFIRKPGQTLSEPQQWRGADVVWDNIPDDEEEEDEVLTLSPIDPETDAARQRIVHHNLDEFHSVLSEPDPPDAPQEFRWQFSLSRMFIGTTAIAVSIGISNWIWPNMLAGTLGLIVFLSLMAIAFLQVEDKRITNAWWVLFAVYVLSSLIAIVSG